MWPYYTENGERGLTRGNTSVFNWFSGKYMYFLRSKREQTSMVS
jgi:hypothetical protein